MFRWVHFPKDADLEGAFVYRITPVFMRADGDLSYGEFQEASIELRRETYPGKLNVAFTRGFVSSQAFVDYYSQAPIGTLLPPKADEGLDFVPTHPKHEKALAWMGFEARRAILELLDDAIDDPESQVRAVLYDLNEPGIVERLEKLGGRLKIIIDDDGAHGKPESGESVSTERLVLTAGEHNVLRQHMGGLQHNKTIVVRSPTIQAAVCGSTNHSWRGFFVQNNNAIVLRGERPAAIFWAAFDHYWSNSTPSKFGATQSAQWQDLEVEGLDAQISFSPRASNNGVLDAIAQDVRSAQSSLFFSLAFLYQTPGAMRNAIEAVGASNSVFSYGISDREVGGLDLLKPDGSLTLVRPEALVKNVPEPFKSEPTGGGGNRMHHKFVVIDFDKPTARVYMGSYNFSVAADVKNGENLVLIRDRRIATSYVIEALRIFDHHHFRVRQADAQTASTKLQLKPAPVDGELPWWKDYYTDVRKIADRELFCP
jgi:phosphatidylserine/phosphatidylglycerophosphate/cardiolipin synthase-like enzyme